MVFFLNKTVLPSLDHALPGRAEAILGATDHWIFQRPLLPPFPEHLQSVLLGMGCFWGAERKLWQQAGVYITAVGYAGGHTPNPYYEEVCSGLTGHAEVVLVVFDPNQTSLQNLLQVFWESHNPTQGMRQGNDMGTQYRSAVYCFNAEHLQIALDSKQVYQTQIQHLQLPAITTEINLVSQFYYAETEHQQYLAKNPNGYCGLRGLGIECKISAAPI